jgi:hypothetical protein
MGNGKTTIWSEKSGTKPLFGKEVINPQICSTETFKLKAVLKNVVREGQNSTQRILQWQVKQGQHSDYAKDGSGKYYASSLWVIFRQIIPIFLYCSA